MSLSFSLHPNFFSVSMTNRYLQKHPTSSVSLNLRACNQFRLTNGFQAEKELKPILERESISSGQQDFLSDIIKHNLVVFRDGCEISFCDFSSFLFILPYIFLCFDSIGKSVLDGICTSITEIDIHVTSLFLRICSGCDNYFAFAVLAFRILFVSNIVEKTPPKYLLLLLMLFLKLD